MAGGDKTVKYSVVVDTDTNADLTSSSLEDLNRRIKNSQDAVKSLGASYRALRGTSDEVKEAKTRLGAALNEERAKVSAASLALEKQGKTLAEVSSKSRALAASRKKLTDEIRGELGVLPALKERWDQLSDSNTRGLAAASIALKGLNVGVSALGSLASFATKSVLALAAAATVAAIAFGKWAADAADAQRTNLLLSEAAMGGAENARNFEQQIDALSQKVRTSKGELRSFAQDVYRSFERSRLSGQGMVDVFNALGQANAAGATQGADKLREILERGKNTGFVGIQSNGLGQDELQGSGLASDDFAKQLATQTKSSVDAIRQQLRYGTVNIDEFAKAARAITERKWGATNIDLLKSLNVQLDKLGQLFRDLVSGVNIQPLLDRLEDLREYLKEGSIGAKEMKEVFQGLWDLLTAPLGGLDFNVRDATDLFVGFALQAELKIGEVEDSILDLIEALGGVNKILKVIGATADSTFGFFDDFKRDIKFEPAKPKEVYRLDDGRDLVTAGHDLGASLTAGISEGIESGREGVMAKLSALAHDSKALIASVWESHSPSRVFEKLGYSVPTGLASGIDRGAGLVGSSVGKLGAVPAPTFSGGRAAGKAGAVGAGGGSAKVDVHMHFPNAKNGEDIMKVMQSQSFRAQVTKVFEEMLVGQAVPVMGGQ